jgi:hypothetical protein
MGNWRSAYRSASVVALLLTFNPAVADAADVYVPAGGNLQAALDAAKPGDTIVLQPGATYVGNFRLPVHGGSEYITIRTAPSDQLPPEGTRISPAHLPYLATIKSPNTSAAMETRPGAAYWRFLLVAFSANVRGYSDILQIGEGSTAQSELWQVPHHIVVDRVYMTGDLLHGQKRGIAINGADLTIINSHIVEMKAIGQDSQAIGGWNGPGPFRIENNHLEGAGEVFMMGGDDPKIPNLTPSDLVFRGNTLTRPLSWRDPIVPAPAGVRATASLDGTLAAGTYAYRVVARRPASNTTAKSPASPEVKVTVAAGARVTVAWDAVPHATDYVVYGRTPGAQNAYWTVKTTSFTDDGSLVGTAGTPSSSGTMWQVKNLFELKHMRRALISYNLMENNWAQAQAGTAILVSPRNQGGSCLWCQVEDITFEYNVIRRTGSGLKILGWDDEKQSLQTNRIVIRNNEFSEINNKVWGGSGYVFTFINGPRQVTIDHNTLISPYGGGVVTVDRPVEDFVFTNNVARHNTYGIQGSGYGYGNTAIAHYFPGALITRNVFAGGSASRYPAGNETPSLADFEQHFSDYAGGDFTLVPGTNWERAGTDGLDLGGNLAAIAARSEMAAPRITTTSLPSTTEFVEYHQALGVTGGRAPFQWSVADGLLPDGLSIDAETGEISGIVTGYGNYVFTVRVQDAAGVVASQPLSVSVARAIPPVDIVTAAIGDATETIPYSYALEAVGGSGNYAWSMISGSLPAGVVLTSGGLLVGTPMAVMTGAQTSGVYSFTVRVVDPTDVSRMEEHSYAMTLVRRPNTAPNVSMSVDATVVPVGATVTLTALPADLDGVVNRVDFYVGNTLVGSAAAPAFTMAWQVPTSGTYTFTAVATDDRGATSDSASVEVTTKSEIVIRASEVARMAGNFTMLSDATAADGVGLWLMNKSLAKVNTAVAAPTHYAEFTFYAEAGRPYRLWVRGRAERNSYSNDSLHVQFDGVASALIGTTKSMVVNLEDDASVGVSGWGWQDNAYGAGMLGAEVVFTQTGLQTIRFQNREDGLVIDQVVLSPEQFLTTAPGALKDDATILAR